MRSMPRQINHGFTLVEMLVVAPIIILVITGLIAVMIYMTGGVLVSQARSQLVYDNQQALAQMEMDVHTTTRFAPAFLTQQPYGSNPTTSPGSWVGTTSPITNDNGGFLLNAYATTTNPRNTMGSLNSLLYVINSPNACSPQGQQIYNSPYTINIIYYISNNTLYRRTYLPPVVPPNGSAVAPDASLSASKNICSYNDDGKGPWQQNSCLAGYVGQGASAAVCKTADDIVAKNVTSMSIKFYTDDAATIPTTKPGDAVSVVLALTSANMVAGNTLTYTGTIQANSANSAYVTP